MTIDKAAAMKQLESLEAEAEKLRAIIDAPEVEGLWRPEFGSAYWAVDIRGGTMSFISSGDICVLSHMKNGSVFPTEETAEKAAPLFARAHKIIQAALQCDPDAGEWTPCRKYSALRGRHGWEAHEFWTGTTAAYVHTREQAKRMAEILNAEGVQ